MDSDLDDYLRDQRRTMAQMDAEIAKWRADLTAKIEQCEAEDHTDVNASPADDDVPGDAPPAYLRVSERVARGEVDWLDVLDGASDDADIRTVHMWLATRLDPVRQALHEVSDDMTPDQAHATIAGALDGDPAGDNSATDDDQIDRTGEIA